MRDDEPELASVVASGIFLIGVFFAGAIVLRFGLPVAEEDTLLYFNGYAKYDRDQYGAASCQIDLDAEPHIVHQRLDWCLSVKAEEDRVDQ